MRSHWVRGVESAMRARHQSCEAMRRQPARIEQLPGYAARRVQRDATHRIVHKELWTEEEGTDRWLSVLGG